MSLSCAVVTVEDRWIAADPDEDESRCLTDEAVVGARSTVGPRGGARRDRTDDLMLAKHALSQLSYGPEPRDKVDAGHAVAARFAIRWWAWEDSNFRPHAYQARALTN